MSDVNGAVGATVSADDPDVARRLDELDPLGSFRGRFQIPQPAAGESCDRFIYFEGNSLGLQPIGVAEEISKVLSDWSMCDAKVAFGPKGVGYGAIESARVPLQQRCAELGASVLGATSAEEVCWMNALTVNLHLMLATFYRPTETRNKILMEAGAFPSDQFAVASQVRWHGLSEDDTVVTVGGADVGGPTVGQSGPGDPRAGDLILQTEDIVDAIRVHRPALVLFGGVQYATGQVFDMAAIARACQDCGAIFGLDLAHAVGNVPLELHAWGVDFAVFCSYKYLNSGPGGLGGIFIHEKHFDSSPRDSDSSSNIGAKLGGWWAQRIDKRFAFPIKDSFDPVQGAAGWQPSNPPSLLLAALHVALELWTEASNVSSNNIPKDSGNKEETRSGPAMSPCDSENGENNPLFVKSKKLTQYLEDLLVHTPGLGPDRVEVVTPAARGAQLSLRILGTDAGTGVSMKEVYAELSTRGVVCGLREPNILRVAPVPLYNTFEECRGFTLILRDVLTSLGLTETFEK